MLNFFYVSLLRTHAYLPSLPCSSPFIFFLFLLFIKGNGRAIVVLTAYLYLRSTQTQYIPSKIRFTEGWLLSNLEHFEMFISSLFYSVDKNNATLN